MALTIRDLGLSFGEKLVLKGLDMQAEAGSVTAFLGPSGCGKSTLLRVLSGLLPFSEGEMNYHEATKPKMSMVFQDAQLLPWRTVKSNVELSLQLREDEGEDTLALLEKVGLGDATQQYPSQLSGGMKMRVSLARALVGRPEILFMDEPFGALDEITRKKMGVELLKFRGWWSSTVFMVTHSMEEALFLADRVLVMPLEAGPWVLDHKVEAPEGRDSMWKRSASFRDQLVVLEEAIHKAMGVEV